MPGRGAALLLNCSLRFLPPFSLTPRAEQPERRIFVFYLPIVSAGSSHAVKEYAPRHRPTSQLAMTRGPSAECITLCLRARLHAAKFCISVDSRLQERCVSLTFQTLIEALRHIIRLLHTRVAVSLRGSSQLSIW